MRYRNRNIFEARTKRMFKDGTKLSDDLLKILFWGTLSSAHYVYTKNRSSTRLDTHSTYNVAPLNDGMACLIAKPFNFSKILIGYSVAFIFAILSPLLGAYLYYEEYLWMFFSVLIFGALEMSILSMTSLFIEDKIKEEWVFSVECKDKQIKQVKAILWLSLIINVILFVINSYPFILDYEGGVLVTLMTGFLYLTNVYCIYESVIAIRNIPVRFLQNINKFSQQSPAKSVSNNIEISYEEPHINTDGRYDHFDHDMAQIHQYQDKCITLGMPVSIIKANIRISNAIIDASKKLPAELTYQIVEEELLEKILLAKRDFVKRECRLAIEILNLLKIKDVDEAIEILKSQYQR